MPTPLKIVGLNDYTRTGARQRWSQVDGYTTVYTYKGPADKLTTFFLSLVGTDPIDITEIDITEGVATVQVTYEDEDGSGGGAATDYNITWELIGQDLFKDIRTFDGTALGTTSFNRDADQAALEAVKKKFLECKIDSAYLAGLVGTPLLYAKFLMRGSAEYVRTQVILRKSIKVGRRSAMTASWVGVDEAWSLAGGSGSPDPSGVGSSALIGTIASMPEADNTKRQWLKRAPQMRQIGGNKWSITQDWWFARRWSYNLYLGNSEDGNP